MWLYILIKFFIIFAFTIAILKVIKVGFDIIYLNMCHKKISPQNYDIIKYVKESGCEVIMEADCESSCLTVERGKWMELNMIIKIRPRLDAYTTPFVDFNTNFTHTLLHEFGHFKDIESKYAHELELRFKRNKVVDRQTYKDEVKAWLIAKRIAKTVFNIELRRDIIKACLNTYKKKIRELEKKNAVNKKF